MTPTRVDSRVVKTVRYTNTELNYLVRRENSMVHATFAFVDVEQGNVVAFSDTSATSLSFVEDYGFFRTTPEIRQENTATILVSLGLIADRDEAIEQVSSCSKFILRKGDREPVPLK